MARTDKYKKVVDQGEVDLVPFMNLLAILIPALMISTEYIKIATIAVASPRIGPKAEAVQKPDENPPLNLSIMLSSNGMYIASANNVLPGAEQGATAQPGPTIPKVNVTVYRARDVSGKVKELARVWNYKGKKFNLGVREIVQEDFSHRLELLKEQYGSVQMSEELDFNYPALNEKLQVIKKAFKDEKQVIISADPQIPFKTVIRIMDASRSFTNDAGEKEFLFPQVVLSAGVV